MKQFFRQLTVLCLVGSLVPAALAQTQASKKKPAAKKSTAVKSTPSAKKPASAAKSKPRPSAQPTPIDPAIEKAKFDAAITAATPAEKAELLLKFLAEFPKSDSKLRAQESLAGARAAMADERLTAGEAEQGVRLFKLAVDDAPKPYGDRLFNGIIATIPANLFWRGQQTAAIEIARTIEAHVSSNPKQLLMLANFYLGTENGAEAKRITESVIKLEETNAAAHQMLAMAHRLNFDLEESAKSYARALELEPESAPAKRSLAEMKRALGKTDEAVVLYREVLAKDENDNLARTGLILSLFDSGKKAEAEADLAKSLEQTPGNVFLLAGAAYWYAANSDSEKAVEFARKAIEKDPRFIWSHIALGRGLMLQKKPVEAEQVFVAARKYGNFPTLQYEIASARLAAGFFQEAGEELKKSFIVEDGLIRTKLGGRIERADKSFTDVIASERRASIFTPTAADSADDAERLKALLDLDQKLAAESPAEADVVALADQFSRGDDNMGVHRKLYAANLLLQKKIGTEKALELAKSATAGVDSSLNVASPGAAVMAGELYEARIVSFSNNDFLLIPDVPRQTLSALMRGRVEDTMGLGLLHQGNAADATIRFRRALSVFPKDSAWWRASTWNLGSALQAEGKESEALDTYISSYKIDKPNLGRYFTIQALYKKINGSTDGLEDKIGPSPLSSAVAASEKVDAPASAAIPEPSPSATPTTIDQSANPETTKPTETKADLPASLPAEKIPAELKPTLETKDDTAPVTGEPQKPVEKAEEKASEKVETVPEKKTEEKPSEKVEPTTEKPKETSTEPQTTASPKPLFDTVVITIPGKSKKPTDSTEAEKTKSDEPKPEPESDPTEAKKPDDESVASGASRPRVVEGKEIAGGETKPCTIGVSQENLSLINNGGTIAVIVSIDSEADIKSVNAVSSSPKDIEIRLEPDIAAVPGRALYVIKSISPNTGMFQVALDAPCGKKDILVRVR